MKRAHLHITSGFTLIELMIVVAILGILAAIAYPNFSRFQLRSKAGEAKLNLQAIRVANDSYFGEYGTYLVATVEPSGVSGSGPMISSKRAWRACPLSPAMINADGFCLMGFQPEGPTYFDYEVWAPNANSAVGGPPPSPNVEYFVVANSDIDGDAMINEWGMQVPNQAGVATAPAFAVVTCTGSNVLDGAGVPGMLGQAGPCAPGMGFMIF